MGVPISHPSIPRPTHEIVTDERKILFPGENIQSATPGTPMAWELYELARAVEMRIINKTAHGLVEADEFKPITADLEVYDDTDATHEPAWIMTQFIDVDNIRVQKFGRVKFGTSLIESGASYDPSMAGNGPWAYWDLSQTLYVSERPADSAVPSVELLHVVSVLSGIVTVELIGFKGE